MLSISQDEPKKQTSKCQHWALKKPHYMGLAIKSVRFHIGEANTRDCATDAQIMPPWVLKYYSWLIFNKNH